jgi:hypothetical protein
MLDLFDLAFIFILINIVGVIWIVLGNYWYKNIYLPNLETVEPPMADTLNELFSNVSTGITDAMSDIKVDIDMEKVSATLTQNFFGTFMAILGVGEEYDPESWTFQNYIKEIIDSSIETIVPETVRQFEEILPAFADQFITGIQEALTGAVSGMPDAPAGQIASPVGTGGMPDLDIGKMMQMMLMQYMMKSMGGAGGLGSLLGGLSGSMPPTGGGQSSGF